MPNFFFTDPSLLIDQASGQSYGPVSNFLDTKYRITSEFSATEDPPAYASCDGMLFVQEQDSNSNLLNVILKPKKQETLEFGTICYIIYRGIKKASLVNSNEVADRTFNDLNERLWAAQDLYNTAFDTTDTPSVKCLGLQLRAAGIGSENLPDSDYLDSVFERSLDFQFPLVNAGMSIGTYDKDSIGFEIWLGGKGFFPEVGDVRSQSKVISVNALPSTPTIDDEFTYFSAKEAILNYIDPCSFFGLHSSRGLNINSVSSSEPEIISDDVLYDNVLSKFFTKDIVYLDIRNEHNHSLNYYRNYNGGVNLSFDGSTSINLSYHDGNYWPIFSLNQSLFSGTGDLAELTINLAKGDNEAPLIYLGQGCFYDNYPDSKGKLRNTTFNTYENYTDDVKIGLNRKSSDIVFPFYLNLRYYKRLVESPTITPADFTLKMLNRIDGLFNLKYYFTASGNLKPFSWRTETVKWYDTMDEVYVNSLTSLENGLICKVCIAEDSNATYLLCLPTGEDLINSNIGTNFVSGYSAEGSFIDLFVSKIIPNLNLCKEDVAVSGAPSATVALSFSNTGKDRLVPSGDEVILLAITSSEKESIFSGISSFTAFSPWQLVIRNESEITDNENDVYRKGEFGLAGYESVSSEVSVIETTANIYFYLPI